MVSTHEDRVYIIKDNPNYDAIKFGKALNARLKSAIGGFDNSCLTHNDYFESDDIYKERKKATSNKDLIGRLLQKEEMVFSSKGGSSIYDGLTDVQIKELNSYLDSIRLDMNLRKWVKEFANKAYEIDPMGLVFIEKDELGNPYPTYKAIGTVYDYQSNGQKLDYVCFELDDDEAEDMLIIPDDENGKEQTEFTFYRFVDDVADYIYKKDKKGNVSLVDKDIKGNSLTKLHGFKNTPAIVVSDIPYFEDTQKFVSKLDKVVELSEMYLNDRSIRDLSKKYHGFPKLVQPIVKCKKCQGSGYIGDVMCGECHGTGNKTIKKISDTIDIPLEMLSENTSLDIKKIFVYITPDIATWDKQDDSLSNLEVLINDCFWGTDNRKYSKGASLTSNIAETATKTMTNLQPVYSRLERTAEWAENLETKITSFIATVKYKTFKSCSIKYGRNYILESTEDLYKEYLSNKKDGSPQYILTDYLERYLKSKYQNNPIELGIAIKMMDVEPFVHYSLKECIDYGVVGEDLQAKRYFSEWYSLQKNDVLFTTTAENLKTQLYTYSQTKTVDVPQPLN